MSDTIEARPDMIGGVPTPPLAVLPKPERLFAQRADRFDQVFAQCAADAAVGEFNELLLCAIQVALPCDQGGIDVHLTHVIHDDGNSAPLSVGQDVIEQSCLAGP
mgnify:CR=1 FL=1